MSTQNQSRTETMKAILGHKETACLFRDAIKSPIGSTSRAKAKKVFNVMNKLQSNYDGAGGPGMAMPQYNAPTQSLSRSLPREPKNVIVFHKLPPMNISYGKKKMSLSRGGLGGPGWDFSNVVLPDPSKKVNDYSSVAGYNSLT